MRDMDSVMLVRVIAKMAFIVNIIYYLFKIGEAKGRSPVSHFSLWGSFIYFINKGGFSETIDRQY